MLSGGIEVEHWLKMGLALHFLHLRSGSRMSSL